LVGLQADIILANSTPVTAAVQRETRMIPIVSVGVADPVANIVARLDAASCSSCPCARHRAALEEQVKTRVVAVENGRKYQNGTRGKTKMPDGPAIFETTGPWHWPHT
jgi:hypothetical protein